MKNRFALSFVWLSAVFFLGTQPLHAQWEAVGPAPAINGQNEGITSPEGPNPVSGCIEAIATSATNANIVFVASPNGGLWRTNNAKSASPTWRALTDQALPSLSLASVAINPLDAKVMFVGAGNVSSFARRGGKRFGIGRSTDGGETWTVVGANLADQNIRRILPTSTLEGGNQVVLAAATAGLYRSVDGGVNYTQVTNGIPGTTITDLAGDPELSTRFYAATNGTVYHSDDAGATWAEVAGTGFNLIPGARVLLATHGSTGNSVVYAAVIVGGELDNVYRSADQGANWTALGLPPTPLFPGKQGGFQGALLADPTDPNIVYISGDRQPDGQELGGTEKFPNVNGANTYSGNIFRNASGAWELMALNGADGTAPHADSRAMVFDADGNILHGCDGTRRPAAGFL